MNTTEAIRLGIADSMPPQAMIIQAISMAIADSAPKDDLLKLVESWMETAAEHRRPCVIFKPRLHAYANPDKFKWSAEFQLGDGNTIVRGEGNTPAEAMAAFDEAWVS